MRIATYNLWNARVRWPERLDAAAEELVRLDADVVALQEVAAQVGEDDGARTLLSTSQSSAVTVTSRLGSTQTTRMKA